MSYIKTKFFSKPEALVTQLDYDLPTTIVAGDLVVLANAQGTGTTDFTAPAGWTKLGTSSSAVGTIRTQFIYRFCDGSEAGTTVSVTFGATARESIGFAWHIGDADTGTAPLVSADASYSLTASDEYASPSLDATSHGAGALNLYLFAMRQGSGTTTFYGAVNPGIAVTDYSDVNVPGTASVLLWCGHTLNQSAGQIPTVTLRSTLRNSLQRWAISIKNKTNGVVEPDATGFVRFRRYHGAFGQFAEVRPSTLTSYSGATGANATDIITITGSNAWSSNGLQVSFSSISGGTGITTTNLYYIIGKSGDTFQISTRPGGSAVNFTTDITAGTLVVHSPAYVNQPAAVGSTLLGFTVDTQTPSLGFASSMPGQATAVDSLSSSTSHGATTWSGATYPMSATDCTDCMLSVLWSVSAGLSAMASQGVAVRISDGANTATYRLALKNNIVQGRVYHSLIALGKATLLESSGSINWSAVTSITYLFARRSGVTTTTTLQVTKTLIISKYTMLGGASVRPWNPDQFVSQFGAHWEHLPVGSGKQVTRLWNWQVGNGSTPTYVDWQATSVQDPPKWSETATAQQLNAQSGGTELRLYTCAACTVDLRSMIDYSPGNQSLVVDPSASTAATVQTAGASIVGSTTTWKTGFPATGMTFLGCPEIDGKAATFTNCTISGSLATGQAMSLDGGGVPGCSFTKGAETYAVRLTTAGITYNLRGFTHSGYTKPILVSATTGTVTIAISAGQTPPTFDTNGAAVVLAPDATAAVARLDWTQTGSTIEIYIVNTATQVYAAAPASGTSWTLNYNDGTTFTAGQTVRIRVRKPGFDPIERTATVLATGWGITATQVADNHYSGLSPANYSVDYANKKIRATGARASFTAQELADIIRQSECTTSGIALAEFADISGLVDLSAGVATAITVNLLGWQVSWAAGSVSQAEISGGNVVGGLSGDVVEDVVGGPQVTVRVSAAATQVTAGGSIPTAEQNAAAVWAYITRTLTSGGGGGSADWTDTEKTQIRHRLGIDGTAAAPSASPSLSTASAVAALPSAATTASAVRTELATELARIDVATSTRNATAPDNATLASINARLPADPVSTGHLDTALALLPDPLDGAATQAAVSAALASYDVATPADLPTPALIADGLLARNLAGGSDGGRTVRDALRTLRNRVAIDGTTLSVYREDDATLAWSATITLASRKPVVAVVPT